MKRGQSGLCGVLAVDKPQGITSHDVVDRVRRITGERRVGHAGTLDPMATGLMLVCVGAATRLSQFLTGHDKAYGARIAFGVPTDTDDAQGRALCAPADIDGAAVGEMLAALDAHAVVAGLVGEQEQLPPAYSAIKKNGVTAYKAAREGAALELEARTVRVHAARLRGTGAEHASIALPSGGEVTADLPFWDVDLEVSKGTYIRAIARDLGARLGCGAHLAALRRTSVGELGVDEAVTLGQLAELAERGDALPWADPARLLGFPVVELDEERAQDVANGRAFAATDAGNGLVSCVRGGKLLAVCECDGGRCKPAVVVSGGVAGVA